MKPPPHSVPLHGESHPPWGGVRAAVLAKQELDGWFSCFTTKPCPNIKVTAVFPAKRKTNRMRVGKFTKKYTIYYVQCTIGVVFNLSTWQDRALHGLVARGPTACHIARKYIQRKCANLCSKKFIDKYTFNQPLCNTKKKATPSPFPLTFVCSSKSQILPAPSMAPLHMSAKKCSSFSSRRLVSADMRLSLFLQ